VLQLKDLWHINYRCSINMAGTLCNLMSCIFYEQLLKCVICMQSDLLDAFPCMLSQVKRCHNSDYIIHSSLYIFLGTSKLQSTLEQTDSNDIKHIGEISAATSRAIIKMFKAVCIKVLCQTFGKRKLPTYVKV